MNLQDYIYETLKNYELSEKDLKELEVFIDKIVSQTEPMYRFMNEVKNDDKKTNVVVDNIRKIVRGENV